MLSYAALVLVLSVAAEKPKEVRIPEEVLNCLDYFVGTWNMTEAKDQTKTIKATVKFEWAPGKPCLRCTVKSPDFKGADVGAGMIGYDVARKEMVIVDFFTSGEHAIERYTGWSGPVWKGQQKGVNENGEAISNRHCSLEKKSPTLVIWKAAESVSPNGEKIPPVELHYRKVGASQPKK